MVKVRGIKGYGAVNSVSRVEGYRSQLTLFSI